MLFHTLDVIILICNRQTDELIVALLTQQYEHLKGWQDLGVPSFTKSAVFLNIVQKGGGGRGVKPMFKNFVANFV